MGITLKTFIPLLDRVLVQRFQPVTKTAGGIVLPENAQEKVSHGKVVAVGTGRCGKDGEVIPVSVSVGETVVLPDYGGTPLKFDKTEYILLRDSDLLGKMKEA